MKEKTWKWWHTPDNQHTSRAQNYDIKNQLFDLQDMKKNKSLSVTKWGMHCEWESHTWIRLKIFEQY